jgi:sugar phosphate isomerase/epimerase
VCVENLDYPLSWHENIVAEFGFSLCADLGHMFLYNEDAQKLVSGLLQGIRVIHLHGVSGEKDHVSLKRHDYGQLKNIVRQVLSKFPGLVTIETFNESDTFESAETIKNIWQK